MASQSVMSTPIFDELLREMRAGGTEDAAEQPEGETAAAPRPAAQPPQPQAQPGGRRRRDSD
ncbi:hypothetical protein [Actinokineospora spheciospongiae]|uniref:hypothetical protein n=1 Tax=Actinokineospora spheciospongiae TaxID=909613 RepID=UPI000D988C58|nr:hypothetical protein [Actinokineospora spheciospongiae]PWW52231.1 hypothetical protein DFQ13_11823 [Actinokineospora spheciospongiae]